MAELRKRKATVWPQSLRIPQAERPVGAAQEAKGEKGPGDSVSRCSPSPRSKELLLSPCPSPSQRCGGGALNTAAHRCGTTESCTTQPFPAHPRPQFLFYLQSFPQATPQGWKQKLCGNSFRLVSSIQYLSGLCHPSPRPDRAEI